MSRFKMHIAAVVLVLLWGVFAYWYLIWGEGSSGFTPVGWMHAVFFLPGGFLLSSIKGSLSNADLPVVAGISLIIYTVAGLLAAQVLHTVFRKNSDM